MDKSHEGLPVVLQHVRHVFLGLNSQPEARQSCTDWCRPTPLLAYFRELQFQSGCRGLLPTIHPIQVGNFVFACFFFFGLEN